MPTEKTYFYQMTGPATQDIYSLEEMAEALQMTPERLRQCLDGEKYGVYYNPPELSIFSYHPGPESASGNFEFNRPAYQGNLKRRHLVDWLMSTGQWQGNPEAARSFVMEFWDKVDKEEDFTRLLKQWVGWWNLGQTQYHRRIADHYKHLATVRQIWRVSKYLEGVDATLDLHGVRFFGPDEAPSGTLIPWERLRVHKTYGFYDQADLPTVKGQFVPETRPEQWATFNPEKHELRPRDLIAGERIVTYPGGYDTVEFSGMVIKVLSTPEIKGFTYTENGRYTEEAFYSDVQTWVTVREG